VAVTKSQLLAKVRIATKASAARSIVFLKVQRRTPLVCVLWLTAGPSEKFGRLLQEALETLIKELREHFPGIVGDMNVVRQHGNRILHGDSDFGRKMTQMDRGRRMASMRQDAILSIRSLFQALEALPKLAR
jgi:hypothetical protein